MIWRLLCIVLPCLFFVACGDKRADVIQGGSSEVVAPQQEDVFSQGGSSQGVSPQEEDGEIIDKYEAPKSEFKAEQFGIVYFAFDSFVLSKDMFKVVDQNAELLKQHPNQVVTLEGNTDAYGSDEYNFALGNKRALAVKEALIVRGVKKDRIKVVSFGETKPVCTKDNSKGCRQENRRVDFVVEEN